MAALQKSVAAAVCPKWAQDCMEGQLSSDHFLAVVVLASAWGTVPHTTPVSAAGACGTAPSTTAPSGRRAASLQVLILQLYPASGLVDTTATNQRACSLSHRRRPTTIPSHIVPSPISKGSQEVLPDLDQDRQLSHQVYRRSESNFECVTITVLDLG